MACIKGHTDIVELLLSVSGIDVNSEFAHRLDTTRSNVYSPIEAACASCHLRIVQLLLGAKGIRVKLGAALRALRQRIGVDRARQRTLPRHLNPVLRAMLDERVRRQFFRPDEADADLCR